MTKSRIFLVLTMLGFFTALLGCKQDGLSGLVPAEGVVMCDGEPLDNAVVSFFPNASDGRTATGKTDANGKFTLTTLIANDGAFPGDYKIAVLKVSAPVGEVQEAEEGESLKEKTARAQESMRRKDSMKMLLPAKYAAPATSGLTQTLSEKGDKEIKIEVSMKN